MKYFINFSSNGFENSQNYGISQAIKFGFQVKGYKMSDIDKSFIEDNIEIFSQKRGAGYWLWKPYIILDALRKIEYNDFLIYMDSGAALISDPDSYLEMIDEKGILSFSMVQRTSKWTKGDCFYLINHEDDVYKFSEMNQLQGTYIFFKKTESSIQFVKKWLNICTNKNAITDYSNIYIDNMSDFIDHRHDQSIFSLLAYNEGIMNIPQIDQYCVEHGLGIDRMIVNRHGIRN
jgi:hypothetical protein